METVISIHDKFFQETFTRADIAKSFLSEYLPEQILKRVNLDDLTIAKDSFIVLQRSLTLAALSGSGLILIITDFGDRYRNRNRYWDRNKMAQGDEKSDVYIFRFRSRSRSRLRSPKSVIIRFNF
jgi:hypothetical protein